MAAEILKWEVKIRPQEKGRIPFRTYVFATTRPMAVQAAELQFQGSLVVEPPKKIMDDTERNDFLQN